MSAQYIVAQRRGSIKNIMVLLLSITLLVACKPSAEEQAQKEEARVITHQPEIDCPHNFRRVGGELQVKLADRVWLRAEKARVSYDAKKCEFQFLSDYVFWDGAKFIRGEELNKASSDSNIVSLHYNIDPKDQSIIPPSEEKLAFWLSSALPTQHPELLFVPNYRKTNPDEKRLGVHYLVMNIQDADRQPVVLGFAGVALPETEAVQIAVGKQLPGGLRVIRGHPALTPYTRDFVSVDSVPSNFTKMMEVLMANTNARLVKE